MIGRHIMEGVWTLVGGTSEEMLGFLPDIIHSSDQRPIADQINDRYQHGGGWSPMAGWTFHDNGCIQHGTETLLSPKVVFQLRDEIFMLYDYAWALILRRDTGAGTYTYEVSRMD